LADTDYQCIASHNTELCIASRGNKLDLSDNWVHFWESG